MIGSLVSISLLCPWVIGLHTKFFISMIKTKKVTAYGVYTTFGEALSTHFWFLFKGLFVEQDRTALETQVKHKFLKQLGQSSDENTLVTHSCRSIFFYIIMTLLEEAKEKKGEKTIKIALPSVHFGSFYKLLLGMEKSMDCKIEFYEIDLNEDDWTLNEQDIDEAEFAKCDLVLCQHLFGVPFAQGKLFQLGKKYNIPILEDCVQSGSMFGNYKGNSLSDIVMYSGGLDKTPQCFGGGFGLFRKTEHGGRLFQKCSAYHEQLPVDTWKARLIGCFNQLLHVCIAYNFCGINNLFGLLAYVWVSERGGYVQWYAISLKIRKAKAIAPFQHAESGFCKKPSHFQLQSMLHGFSKDYRKVALDELRKRDLLLQSIPSKHHAALFPWWTPKVIQQHKDNWGVSEVSWVFTPTGEQRMGMCQWLNDHFFVSMINTTWEFHEKPVSRNINNNLVYLPNINHLEESDIEKLASVLTKYCESLETQAR